MTRRSAVHDSFTIERAYGASPSRVFAAWADPESKRRWFAPTATSYSMDFRVGGIERNSGGGPSDGPTLTFESVYHDIVDGERIVFTSTLLTDDTVVSVSLTTVQLMRTDDGGTTVILDQHNVFLDGHEHPDWRRAGTHGQLDALARELTD